MKEMTCLALLGKAGELACEVFNGRPFTCYKYTTRWE